MRWNLKTSRRFRRRLSQFAFVSTFCTASLLMPVHEKEGSAVYAATPTKKVVYLTFDDGPNPLWTPQVLSILAREHVHATFFVLGFRAQKYPWLVRRMHREGHEIGNHGYYHTFIVDQNQRWVEAQVRRADQAIQAACGVRPMYFRPPGGILNPHNVEAVRKLGHPIAMWTVDTNDWRATRANSILQVVERDTRPGSIILMHDGIDTSSRYTVQALPQVIHYLKQSGYTFAVLPEHYRGTRLGVPTAPSRKPPSR
ncbi:MAG: polysaccharide deacetylase family protein [Alicyclobacillus herbarius]|uniref:polysaccharide deacetylase family protein n=1 Tax=Alicyclobacillus herbarius TaxID=122960 RepID=UPI002357D640|nr:polysaccharide deacetylase family protein [Alicyclobacillus herbarius]MCL6632040.1 polysaccharide deacetylase family protein [Alicyclobacillus herbarius]